MSACELAEEETAPGLAGLSVGRSQDAQTLVSEAGVAVFCGRPRPSWWVSLCQGVPRKLTRPELQPSIGLAIAGPFWTARAPLPKSRLRAL